MKKSARYGCIHAIGRKTLNKCHLCHKELFPEFHGRPGTFGDDTVGVDHLIPQAFGGDDHPSNLLLAHASCNSRRGVRPVDEVRLELAGTTEKPLGHVGRAVLVSGGVGLVAGFLAGERGADGKLEFNSKAAVTFGLIAGITALVAS